MEVQLAGFSDLQGLNEEGIPGQMEGDIHRYRNTQLGLHCAYVNNHSVS
jgi:hypothetical protein